MLQMKEVGQGVASGNASTALECYTEAAQNNLSLLGRLHTMKVCCRFDMESYMFGKNTRAPMDGSGWEAAGQIMNTVQTPTRCNDHCA